MYPKIENARRKLLQCGKELIFNRNSINFSVSELTDKCGIGTGTFYDYFKSKDDFIMQILHESRNPSSGNGTNGDNIIYEAELLSHTAAGMGVFDVTGDTIEMKYINDEYYRMISASRNNRDNFSGKSAINAVHPHDRKGLTEEAQASIREHRQFYFRFRVLSDKGGYMWLGAHANHVPFGRNTERFYAVYYNMDAYIGEQNKLKKYNDNIDRILGNIPGGVAVFSDRDGAISLDYTNDGFFTLHHGSREYWLNVSKNPVMWLYAPDRHFFYEEFESVRTGKKECGSATYRVIGEDGNMHWVNNQFKHAYILDGIQYYYSSFASLDELKKSEAARIEARMMYEFAVEHAKLVVWKYDILNHRIIMAENEFTKYDYRKFGLTKIIENAPQSLLPYIDDKYTDVFLEMYKKIEEGAPSASCEVWYKLNPGTEPRCEHLSYTTIFDDNGKPVSAYGIGQNITMQKQEEERYAFARKQLEDAHPANLGSFHLNLTKNICCNGKSPFAFVMKQAESGTVDGYFAEFAKLIADENVKKEFFRKFDRELLLQNFRNGKTTESIHYPFSFGDGTIHWRDGQLYMLMNPSTGDVEAITYAIDIDEQKKNELIANQIINKNFDYCALINPVSRLTELRGRNTSGIFGTTAKSLEIYENLVSAAEKFVAPDNYEHYRKVSAFDNILDGLQNNESYSFSYKRIEKGKLHLRNITFYWLERVNDMILMLSSDITAAYEQEKTQADTLRKALLEAERASTMKTEFLSNVSHDMRTPLNAVLGYTALALRSDEYAVKTDYLYKINEAGKILLSLINDTLDLAKIETGVVTLKPEPITCSDMLSRIVAAVKPSIDNKHINFVIDNSRAVMATINIDALRVQEIFINLISNAVKFTPEDGNITLVVECTNIEKDRVHDRITVRDNGCGMSSSFLPKIFEPFSQERTEKNSGVSGSGLGLSIVKRLVDLMGGTIEVKSTLGIGTEFIVCLDFERMDDKIAAPTPEKASPDPLKNKHVLICEDNAMNTEIARSLLEMRDIRTTCSENGLDGYNTFIKSAAGTFDAILMDIRMPIMNGYEATKKIRTSSHPDATRIPIFAMSADAYDDDVKKAINAGMNGHISKPIDPEKLFAALSGSDK